jgi:mannosyltransferase OCH1-like enzyme
MIPKIIHYCWFGGNPKSEIIEKCMHSWRQHCPDWEIREWNEENFDVAAFPYTQEAYAEKKWAFVSDVARLYAVYECGGVYLDTDVELLQAIDGILSYDAVFAFETEVNINTGRGFAAQPHHNTVEKMLECYRDIHFLKKNGKPDLLPCTKRNTEALKLCYSDFKQSGATQVIDGVCVLSSNEYTKYANHYGAMSWHDGKPINKKPYKDTRLKRFLRTPEKFIWVEKNLGKKAMSVYTFLSYDLLEMGPWFYIKRKLARKR